MSYIVNETNGAYVICENESGTNIEVSSKDSREVYNLARKLNLGSGFNGWTPNFIARRFKNE